MSVYLAPYPTRASVHRVLVLPFAEGDSHASQLITASFAQALQNSQNFEVVMADAGQIARIFPELSTCTDRFTAATLVVLAKNYNVQAILCGRITCHSLIPNTLGLKVHLISTGDSEILWAVDTVIADKEFYATHQRSVDENMLSLSPQDFTLQVCRQVVSSLKEP